MSLPIVAVVGRPNVGKSTLVNRLVGERVAIVHDTPGITRDRHYAASQRYTDQEIMVVDTGGLEPHLDDDLFAQMRSQALIAVDECDAVVFVVDARAGLTPMDEEVARLLRQADRPVFVAVNKVESEQQESQVFEFYSMGLENLYAISAEHGLGVAGMMEDVEKVLPPAPAPDEEVENELRIAIIGRPNIGKSTLVNRLVGEQRHVVHDMPGTTMDPVDSVIEVGDRTYRFVDTAGIRRRSRIDTQFEGFAVSKAIRSIERCHISLLMIDGDEGVSEQDARLARVVIERGRGLMLLFNKWDLVRDDPDKNVRTVEDDLDRRMPHTTWAPVLYISALTGKGCHRILEGVEKIYEQFDKRLSTSECNRFLNLATENHSVPQRYTRPVKLNYMTQVRVRPPQFVIWSNAPEGVDESYKRYLVNRLREQYSFEGSPIKIEFRQKRRTWEEEG
ncbi:MAG: ribosome biogenesis GTPase Der [Proteobacteria bacterium]|nr:ribosome biogenesis GTPase Der [Pseudomonadota bacterium]MCP4915746.1 ribosome biogenesis GTPase Der [Pseudomonadota bacterium]